MGIKIDSAEFQRNLRHIALQATPAMMQKAVFAAANELLRDAIRIIPRAPFDEGHLRASARVDDVTVTPRGVTTNAGFNIVYAARWHELTPAEDARINWSLPGSGRKYLESKLQGFGIKYVGIVIDRLRSLLQSGGTAGSAPHSAPAPRGFGAYYDEYGGVD